jgi:ribosomal protein L16 Arg81 hydroxylase
MENLNNIIKKVLKEESERYMFFSNLEQIRRQCGLLLDLDRNMVEEILSNGHDWAQDHIAEAKNNMDQVFDFLMNESKSGDMWKSEEVMEDDNIIDDLAMTEKNPDKALALYQMTEGRKKAGTKLCARGNAAAKSKFDVYPSAYANGYAVQVCKGTKPGLDGKKHCSGAYC